MIEHHINQYIEQLQKKNRIDFNRLSYENPLIAPLIAEDVKARISKVKKKKIPGASKINEQNLQHVTPNIIDQITNIFNAVYLQDTCPKHSRK